MRRAFGGHWPVAAAALCGALLLLAAADASAATRFAAPGGNNVPGSECLQASPCSLFNAADRFAPGSKLLAGDEVVVEPGNYSGVGDLGPEEAISAKEGTSIHGLAGEPRPVITSRSGGGSGVLFLNRAGVTLSRLEIVALGERRAVDLLFPGTVDGVVARASKHVSACLVHEGLFRDSACLSTGDSESALEITPPNSIQPQTTVRLRNVTAIATATGSHGLDVRGSGNVELTVDGVGVLARGGAKDVFAGAFSGSPPTAGAATVAVDLDHSDFERVELETDGGGGTATVSEAGKGTNIIADPLLAADGYHELPGSLTIDAGAIDASSGTADVDGNQRVIGLADIGADEFQLGTATSLSCSPASVVAAIGSTTCTATVASASGSPDGTVRFASDGPGAFAGGASCSLVASGNGQASCQLAYLPSPARSATHALTASYQGDSIHGPSQGSTSVGVVAARVILDPPPKTTSPPNTTLKRKPARKTASRQVTFTFASDQANSRFECKLDRKPFKPCHSPFKATVKPGRHSFQVRAVNRAGAADPTPAVFRWKVVR